MWTSRLTPAAAIARGIRAPLSSDEVGVPLDRAHAEERYFFFFGGNAAAASRRNQSDKVKRSLAAVVDQAVSSSFETRTRTISVFFTKLIGSS